MKPPRPLTSRPLFGPGFNAGFGAPEILRLSDALKEDPAPRAPARGRPHAGSALDRVRHMVETTPLSYRDIARRTGISIATISRRAKQGGWIRPETTLPLEHYTEDGRRIRRAVVRARPNGASTADRRSRGAAICARERAASSRFHTAS